MTASLTGRRSKGLLIVGLVAAVVVAVIVVVLVVRGGSSGTSVPPLTAAEKRTGAVRVTYPDRSLPDEPEVAKVGGQRVALFFEGVTGSGDHVTATLGVVIQGSDPPQIRHDVTLQKGQTTVVEGLAITLLDAFATGDLEHDAADVSVTIPNG